jgi:hypothetical protein
MTDKILIDRAVVESALDALEDVQNYMKTSAWFDRRAAALRAALKEATMQRLTDTHQEIDAALEQQEQEPVAWIPSQHLEEARRAPFVCRVSLARQRHRTDFVALYTHPPRREWVGLTDEEIRMIVRKSVEGVTVSESVLFRAVARAVETALKGRNT